VHAESLLDEEVTPRVTGVPSTTDAAYLGPVEGVDAVVAEPIEEVEVTKPENPEGTLPVEESPATELVPEPSKEVKEVAMDTEPVIATPLSNFAVPEHMVDQVVTEGAPAVNFVEDATPDIVTEEKSAVEEPAPVVAAPVEEPESSPEVLAHVSEPTAEPAAEGETASDVFNLNVPALEPQETEAVYPPVPPEEEPSIDEAEPEVTTPSISEPVEAAQDVATSDVPQEETKQVERPWTRSYSVSSQGGVWDSTVPADEEVVEPTTAPEPPVDKPATEPTPRLESVTPAEVRAFSISFPSRKIDQLFFRSPPLLPD